MATFYLSEAEVLRDPAGLLARARDGAEVVIEGEESVIARLVPADGRERKSDPEYEAWFLEQIEEALAGPRKGIDAVEVETHFAERRRASALRLAGVAG